MKNKFTEEILNATMKTNFAKFALLLALTLFFASLVNAQSNHHSKSNDDKSAETEKQQSEKKSGEDKPLEILEKSPPRVSIFEKCFEDYGTAYVKINVRVTFHSSGRITDVEIAKDSGCKEFDEESLRVARLIKFKPAVKDGEAVTVIKQVVYEGGIR